MTDISGRCLLVLAVAAKILFASERDTATIIVVASGETHGMQYPCDCPGDPGGGLAERASAIRKAFGGGPDDLLLLDAGGFAGGGIYDDNTGGRAADSVRTAAVIRAMGLMKYDAVAAGDDDLQYGGAWLAAAAAEAGMPLVSANTCLTGSTPGLPAFRIAEKGGVRFAVTAVASQEQLFPRSDSCRVRPPAGAVRKIWKEMGDKADFRIILSHLGEEATLALADSFPDCAVIVNGHRKVSQSAAVMRGKTLVMQFGFGGKKLSWAVLRCSKRHRTFRIEKSGWLGVGRADGADSAVAKALAGHGGAERRNVYDLYLMSQCSYGCSALREFTDFVRKFPDVEWNLWFVGSLSQGPADSLSSLHGDGEIIDEMEWLAVRALYPGRWLRFLAARAGRDATTDNVVAAMGLSRGAIDGWVKESGRRALAGHYRRAMRLGITASPTLLVNNAAFERPVESRRLIKAECSHREKRPSLCDSLPECYDDQECVKKGMIGRCLSAGKCGFFPDKRFSFVTLIADSTVQHPETAVIATTADLFPNAAFETVMFGSAKGRAMAKKYAPPALPFYVFSDSVAGAHNFSRIEGGLEKIAGGFTFKRGITPNNYFPGRQGIPGSAALFIDPLFPDAVKAAGALLADTLLAGRVRIRPVIYSARRNDTAAIDVKVRREEALRWLILDSLHRDAFPHYLARYVRDAGGSYWFINLSASGIAQDLFINEVRAGVSSLDGHERLLDTLGMREPVTVLLGNREKVVIRNEAELAEVFAVIKKRAEKRR